MNVCDYLSSLLGDPTYFLNRYLLNIGNLDNEKGERKIECQFAMANFETNGKKEFEIALAGKNRTDFETCGKTFLAYYLPMIDYKNYQIHNFMYGSEFAKPNSSQIDLYPRIVLTPKLSGCTIAFQKQKRKDAPLACHFEPNGSVGNNGAKMNKQMVECPKPFRSGSSDDVEFYGKCNYGSFGGANFLMVYNNKSWSVLAQEINAEKDIRVVRLG